MSVWNSGLALSKYNTTNRIQPTPPLSSTRVVDGKKTKKTRLVFLGKTCLRPHKTHARVKTTLSCVL